MSKEGQVGLWIVEIKKCIRWKSIAVVLDCLSLLSEVFFFFLCGLNTYLLMKRWVCMCDGGGGDTDLSINDFYCSTSK